MYSVHCRVIVDNKCEFQHSSSRVDCTVWCKTREPNVEEILEEFKKHVCWRILIKQFTVSTRQTLVQIRPGPEKKKKTSALSVIIAYRWALKVIANFETNQCSQNLALHLVIATAVMIRSWHIRLDGHDQRWPLRASLRVSMFTLGILFVHNGVATHHQIHHRLRQHSYTNPANLQCCCCIIAEPDIVQTSVQIAVNTLLILGEVPVLDSFLHPAVPRVDVFRSLSCSQSIRQRIRCRTVTLYFNLHWTSQEHRSQWSSNLTSFHRWVKLRLSNAQCCQALTRRSRLHSVVTDLSHHSRRALPPRLGRQQSRCPRRLWSCQLFLSSKSQRCCGLSHQIPRCTFQRVKVEFQRLALSLDQMLRCFSKIQSVLCQVWKSFPSKSVSCCFIFLQNRTPSSVWTSVWSSV